MSFLFLLLAKIMGQQVTHGSEMGSRQPVPNVG